MQKIRKGDTVIVRKGRDAGRRGVVLAVLRSEPLSPISRVVVEGINLVKKHTKADPSKERPGGIVEKETSIAISNIAIWNQAAGKADRVGFKFLEDGSKVRIFKSTGDLVDIE
jgi:large subunit ribosomal protein L24